MTSIIFASDLLADLFTTNRAPNDGELALARTLICTLESQLNSLVAGAANSDSGGHTETSISESLAALRRVVAPIRRVPTDVINEVFLACIDEDHSLNPGCVDFSRISSGLRKIALSTPALWTVIKVHIEHNDSEVCVRGKKYWLKELIHRSGNLPLDISLYDWTESYKERPINGDYNEIMNLLCSCHLRWREATLASLNTCTPIIPLLTSLSPNDFPMLNKIDFSVTSNATRMPKYIPVLASPSLKKVLNVTFDNIIDHRLYLPLATITHLVCSSGEWRPSLFIDFANVLRQCASLVSLTFAAGDETEWIKPAIELPYLQDLSVIEDEATLCIFMAINAPRLQSLLLELGGIHYGDYSNNPPGFSDEIATFLERSPNVQTLRLQFDTEMDAYYLQEILQSCPQLVTLECSYTRSQYSNWEGVLLDFVGGNTFNCNIVCPNLQYLDVDIGRSGGWYTGKFDTLKKLITRKLEPSPSLAAWKRLKITFRYRNKEKQAADRLFELSDSNRIIIEGVKERR